MIVDASEGFYVLRTDAADPSDIPARSGLKLFPGRDHMVVATVGHSDDKRVEITAQYLEHDGARRLADWPGDKWRSHMARTSSTSRMWWR